nr:esterase [Menippe mercenaria nudivirus]
MKNKDTPYIILTSVLTLIFLIIILYFISIIVNPKQPISYLQKQLNVKGHKAELEQDSTNIEPFSHKGTNLHLYYYEQFPSTDTVIIDLPGGAFISSSNTFAHYKHTKQPHTIVSIEYPVLPKGNYNVAKDFIAAAIDYIANVRYPTKRIILSAASAGCYYATKIINEGKYNDRIVKYICISGYFGYDTIPNIYTFVCEKVYLHQFIKKSNRRTYEKCNPIPPHILTFYATGANDPLKISTVEFLRQSGEEDRIIEYQDSDHCFYLYYNKLITMTFYENLAEFINL